MSRIPATIVGLTLLLGVGLVHGWWTQRWRAMPELAEAVARLEGVPGDFGRWRAEETSLPPENLARAGAAGSRLQRFTSPRSRYWFSTILLCGRSGPLSVHRPEHCYPGAGYNLFGAPVRHTIRDREGRELGEFYTARFIKREVTGSRQLRIFWSWHDGTSWRAPDYPRWSFAAAPYLYKLYVIREVDRLYDDLDDDPSVEFLREFLAEVNPHLIADCGLRIAD
jgi:hypothetical protein